MMARTTDGGERAQRPGRYPYPLLTKVDERQDTDIREFADAVNRSISEVARDALAAGLPILRQRAIADGTLVA